MDQDLHHHRMQPHVHPYDIHEIVRKNYLSSRGIPYIKKQTPIIPEPQEPAKTATPKKEGESP